jgi:signal transduction histidine kinase
MYAIGRDVTEQVKMAEDLKKAMDTKNKLFSVISHDLKSQLAGLIQMTGMMSDKEYNFSKEELISYSGLLHTSSKNLHELLENLLNWSKIQRGMMRLEKTEIDLQHLFSQATDPFIAAAKAKNIDFQISVERGLRMIGDEQMITSVIRNLVSNAIKFTPMNGSVHVKANQENGGDLTRCSLTFLRRSPEKTWTRKMMTVLQTRQTERQVTGD